jgi:tetratricopeptide (TPR) repeat protein
MQSIEEQRNRAANLLAAGDLPGALQCAGTALATAPDDVFLLQILADIYDRAGEWAQALKICQRLAILCPRDPAPRLKAGHLLLQLLEYGRAEKEFVAALKIEPTNAAATDGLTNLWRLSGKVAEARALLLESAAHERDPARAAVSRFKAAFAQPVVPASIDEIEESRARYTALLASGPAAPIPDPLGAGLGGNFFLGYQAKNDRQLQESLAAYYRAACPTLTFTARHVGRRPTGKLRVGIVSNYFSHHTVGYLSLGLIAGLDRTRFDLTLFRTPYAQQDTATSRFLGAAPCVDLPNDLAAARQILADAALDVLHYPEVGMDHMTYFLAFARLATVQTVAWGHPITTGLSTIDHFLSVADMEPDSVDAHYTENLVRLRGLSFAAEPPRPTEANRAEAGLTAAPAYVCSQSLYKVHPDFDTVIGKLLEDDRDGHVFFVSLGAHADAIFRKRVAESAGPHMDRLHILPRTTKAGFLRLVKSADVVLDVPQWSGGKTSLETLALGTPVVHWPGEFMRGRHTLAFYRRMGISAPVVNSAEDYVRTALRLAHDSAFRADVRGQIEEAQSTLFADWASIREIEDVWAAAVESGS